MQPTADLQAVPPAFIRPRSKSRPARRRTLRAITIAVSAALAIALGPMMLGSVVGAVATSSTTQGWEVGALPAGVPSCKAGVCDLAPASHGQTWRNGQTWNAPEPNDWTRSVARADEGGPMCCHDRVGQQVSDIAGG